MATTSLILKAMVRPLAPLLLLMLPWSATARDVRTVEGHSIYVVPRTVSLEEAETIALQRAITDALAAEFGTVVQSEVWTELYNTNDQSTAEAWQNGLNLVKGEWLETIGRPDIKLGISSEGYVVEVAVRGRAMAIATGNVDLSAALMQVDSRGISNGSHFRSGNRLIVDFTSPVDGYVAIFLADATAEVAQLLPFAGEEAKAHLVRSNRRYSFFSDNSGVTEEQYTLFTTDTRERNIVYLLFSTSPFSCPIAEIDGSIRTLKSDEFRRWLTRRRTSDTTMQTLAMPVVIIGE